MLELITHTVEQDHNQEGWLCYPLSAGDVVTLIHNTLNKKYYRFGYRHRDAAECVKHNLEHGQDACECAEDYVEYDARYVPEKRQVIISSINKNEINI